MSKTLLNGCNEVLKRAGLIQGDSGALTSLSDSPRQVWIDTVVQAWNETMEELYSSIGEPMPKELGENTITLVTGDRDYALQPYNTLYWPFQNETTGQLIYEWTGDYLSLIRSQWIPADFTGQPIYGVIRPTDEQVYLDRIPTSAENGDVYKYRYDKDLSVSAASDTFPFKDVVFRALVPAVTEVFLQAHKREFAGETYDQAIGRAGRELSGKVMRTHWGKQGRSQHSGIFAPFHG